MGYYQKFNKNKKKGNWNGNSRNDWQKPSYRKPSFDPAKAAAKKLKEEEKKLTYDQLTKYIPIFQSMDILHCVGMFNKIRKKITTNARQVLKMIIVNKLIYHNPMLPYQGEIPDEVQEVNEYIEKFRIPNLKVEPDEENILKVADNGNS